MFAYIAGELTFKSPVFVVVDVGGVGFKMITPLSTYYKLPDTGKPVKLFIHSHIREDDFSLYGFLTMQEKESFELLLSVSGVGPKVATNILSELSADELRSAIAGGNASVLTSISGIGRKTAQRILLELGSKIEDIEGTGFARDGRKQIVRDAISALTSLGYSKNVAEDAIQKAAEFLKNEFSIEELIKQSLKNLR